MTMMKKIRVHGLSFNRVNVFMMITALVMTAVLLGQTLWTSSVFTDLRRATDDYLAGQDAAYMLADASDYLTEEAQEFTVSGDPAHLENYFRELLEDRRRETAVAEMPGKDENTSAYQNLQAALEASDALKELECRAMALAASGYGLDRETLPETIREIDLAPADAALSPGEQIEKAETMLFGEEYYARKEQIRSVMDRCVREMVSSMRARQNATEETMSRLLLWLRLSILLFAALVIFFLWLNYRLGIRPVLQGVQRIQQNASFPVEGAAEVRYLAQAYNKLFETYKKDISHLNYEASHDKLTGAYNRVGYELLRQELDLNNTALLMVDLDHFKTVNDTYGHDAGDRVLIHLVRVLHDNFRSEDYVCRLGGDEFVVFMVHSYPEYENLIREKVAHINHQLQHPPEDVPATTVSVGVAFGENVSEYEVLMERADAALYRSKEMGRSSCSFYRP